MSRRRRLSALLLCLALFLAGCGGGKERGVSLKLTFLDTGKSDCIVIEAGESVVLNDTADADDVAAICAYLDERGTTWIEYLILSHFDKDHIGGAAGVV